MYEYNQRVIINYALWSVPELVYIYEIKVDGNLNLLTLVLIKISENKVFYNPTAPPWFIIAHVSHPLKMDS